MSNIDTLQVSEGRVNPALLMGAVSPLWGYFGAVAAGGVAYWWMTRWARPMNAEAVFGAARSPAEMSLEVVEMVEPRAAGHSGVEGTAPESMPPAEAVADAALLILGPGREPESEPVPDVDPATISATEVAPLVATSQMAPPPEPEPEPTQETKPFLSASVDGAPATEKTRPPTPRVRKQAVAMPDAEA